MLKRLLQLPSRSCFLFGPRLVGKTTLVQSTIHPETSRTYDLLRTEPMRRICVCRAPHARRVGTTEVLPWREYFRLLMEL